MRIPDRLLADISLRERPSGVFVAFSLLALLGLYAASIGPLQFLLPIPLSSAVLALLALISVVALKRIRNIAAALLFIAILLSGLAAALVHERIGTIRGDIFGRVCNLVAIAVIVATLREPLARCCLTYFHRINTYVLVLGLLSYVGMLATGVDLFWWTRDEFHGAQASLFRLRHTFIFSEPAYLSSLVAIHIAALAVLKGGLRYMRTGMVALFAVTLLLTFSFSGMLTLCVFLFLLFVQKRLGLGWRIAAMITIMMVLYGAVSVEAYLFNRLELIVAGAKSEPRLIEFLRGFDAYRCEDISAALLGHGIGSYGIVEGPCYRAVNHQTSNNTLADLMFENGLVGVAIVLFALLVFFRRSGVSAVALLVAASMYRIELFGMGAIYYAMIYQAGHAAFYLSSASPLSAGRYDQDAKTPWRLSTIVPRIRESLTG